MGLGNSSQMFSLTFIQNVNIIIAIFHAGQRTKIFRKIFVSLKSATTRLYDTEAKIICIVSKKGAQCIECHHKDI